MPHKCLPEKPENEQTNEKKKIWTSKTSSPVFCCLFHLFQLLRPASSSPVPFFFGIFWKIWTTHVAIKSHEWMNQVKETTWQSIRGSEVREWVSEWASEWVNCQGYDLFNFFNWLFPLPVLIPLFLLTRLWQCFPKK